MRETVYETLVKSQSTAFYLHSQSSLDYLKLLPCPCIVYEIYAWPGDFILLGGRSLTYVVKVGSRFERKKREMHTKPTDICSKIGSPIVAVFINEWEIVINDEVDWGSLHDRVRCDQNPNLLAKDEKSGTIGYPLKVSRTFAC